MPASAKEFAKAAIKMASSRRYHWIHAKEAFQILNDRKQHGAILSDHDRRQCDAYANDVFGHKHFAPWLYVYSSIAGGFREGWIPDNYYGSVVVPRNSGKYGNLSFLKPLNSIIFNSHSFPDLLSYANGIFFDQEYHQIPAADAKDILFKHQDLVVFKLDSSFQGKGIYIMNSAGFCVEHVQRLGNGLFQAYIEQHCILSKFSKDSVATLRLTTVYHDNGEVSARAAYLRFGDGNDKHVQSKSHIRVPINLKTGAFYEVGYTPKWIPITAHPTSKVIFAGYTIPNYKDCIHIVKGLHKKVPYTRCVGWDLAVDVAGKPRLMEWNAQHNDIKFSEATQGPCFADLDWDKFSAR